jgi:hypothetical protein
MVFDEKDNSVHRMEATADRIVKHDIVPIEINDINKLHTQIGVLTVQFNGLYVRTLTRLVHGLVHNTNNRREFVHVVRGEMTAGLDHRRCNLDLICRRASTFRPSGGNDGGCRIVRHGRRRFDADDASYTSAHLLGIVGFIAHHAAAFVDASASRPE